MPRPKPGETASATKILATTPNSRKDFLRLSLDGDAEEGRCSGTLTRSKRAQSLTTNHRCPSQHVSDFGTSTPKRNGRKGVDYGLLSSSYHLQIINHAEMNVLSDISASCHDRRRGPRSCFFGQCSASTPVATTIEINVALQQRSRNEDMMTVSPASARGAHPPPCMSCCSVASQR